MTSSTVPLGVSIESNAIEPTTSKDNLASFRLGRFLRRGGGLRAGLGPAPLNKGERYAFLSELAVLLEELALPRDRPAPAPAAHFLGQNLRTGGKGVADIKRLMNAPLAYFKDGQGPHGRRPQPQTASHR